MTSGLVQLPANILAENGFPTHSSFNDKTEPVFDDPNREADCILTCPNDIWDVNDPGVCGAIVNYSIGYADCDPYTLDPNLPSGSEFPVGTTVITVTAGSETCSFSITVEDIEPPTLNCPADMLINLDPGLCSAFVNYNVSGDDNCAPSISIVQIQGLSSGSEFPIGTTTNCFVATDEAGNTNWCCFYVTVLEFPNPTQTLACNDNAEILLEEDGCVIIGVGQVLEGGPYGCYEDYFVEILDPLGLPAGNEVCCDDVGETYTARVTDPATGNKCWGTITILDELPPTALCLAELVADIPCDGTADIFPWMVDGGSSDNCDQIVLEFLSQGSVVPSLTFTVSNLGPNPVELLVTDGSGNQSLCSTTILVIDLVPSPEVITPANQVLCNGDLTSPVVFTGNLPGMIFEWTNDNPSIGLPASGNGDIPSFPAINSTNTPLIATITVKPFGDGCYGDSNVFTITINTLPIVFAGPDTKICEGDSLNMETLGAFIEENGSGVTSGSWGTDGTGTFEPSNEFPPGAVYYVPSAGDIADGFVVISLTSADPEGPCSSVSDAFILAFKGEEPVACNDTVMVALDGDGVSEVLPDMVLEGTYDYDFFLVEIYDGINLVGNTVDCGDIGATLTVKVTDICTGNHCWGNLNVVDEWAPILLCDEVNMDCTFDYNLVPYPPATDNCDVSPVVELTYLAIFDEELCTENQMVVLREFIAADQYGNHSAPCAQTITISRPDYVDFPDDIEWECSEYDFDPGIVEATADGSGVPAGIDGEYCLYSSSFSDQIMSSCGTGFQIVRTWTVLDWCTGTVVTENPLGEDNVQLIKVTDTTPPSIALEPFTVPANIQGVYPEPCASTGFLPPPVVSDECNTWTIRILTPAGEAEYINGADGTQGGFIPYPGLELGTHIIQYQATDACNNIADLYVEVTVIDNIAPVPVCDEITQVNLSSDGLAVVNAENFDDGSYDNCCLGHFEARRMEGDCYGEYDDFGPAVEFCCSDAGYEGEPVAVILRVFDCDGNYNDCMVTVNVIYYPFNDNQPPVTLSCPESQPVTCEDYQQNLAAGLSIGDYSVLDGFGTPAFSDDCAYSVSHWVSVNLDECLQGTITRTWVATDGNNSTTCTQDITVAKVSDWVVQFPADVTAVCANGQLPDLGGPEIFFAECELIAVSYYDIIYTLVPDACYRIVRTWNVINWCTYDDFGYDAFIETGYAECDLYADWDGDGDQDCRTFRDGWNADGTPGTPDGYISYSQIIKVIDEDPPVFSIPYIDGFISDWECTRDVVLPYPNIDDNCSPEIEVDISGDLGNANNITGDVVAWDIGIGEYEVTYTVTDNCGNTSYKTVIVVVFEGVPPTAFCKNGLVVEIAPSGTAEIIASMLDEYSYDNCGSIAHFSFSPDINDTSWIFTCSDLGTHFLEMWVTDGNGNQNYCGTFIEVQDNFSNCNTLTVAGALATEENEGLAGADIQVNGGIFSEQSNLSGYFEFSSLTADNDYTITPHLDLNPANGVTTWDLVLITRHILGIGPLESPYKIIAADANKSGTVTTIDMVAIRKVILQIEQGFPNNTSWRFVDKDFVFADPANPFQAPFPEVINYNNLTASDLSADFVAVKVGDVNGSALTNASTGAQNRTFTGAMRINANDRQLKAGRTCEVAFAAEAVDLLGYQFTLHYNSGEVEVTGILDGLASGENFGMPEDGVITTSWNSSEPRAVAGGEVLFILRVKATTDVMLSDAFRIGSSPTPAEAYDAHGALLDVKLAFDGVEANDFTLFQNTPNPWKNQTVIGFILPEGGQAMLTVFDETGRMVFTETGDFKKGYNAFVIENRMLAKPGIFHYRVQTEKFAETRRMILMD